MEEDKDRKRTRGEKMRKNGKETERNEGRKEKERKENKEKAYTPSERKIMHIIALSKFRLQP